jgi:hypothetical protein
MPAIGETFSQGFSPLGRFMAWFDRSKTWHATYEVVLS